MYRLIRDEPAASRAPELDDDQRAVIEHAGGPLLVLGGPGSGKTTTLVEAVVDRIARRGLAPDAILVLTFSRRAATDLRARIANRLGRTTITPMVLTFHAFCYALVRRFAEIDGLGAPVRLLTGPEQEFRVRETLAGSLETGQTHWVPSLDGAFPTRAFAAEVRAVLARARQLGMDPDDVVEAGAAADRPEWVSIGEFFEEYLDVLDAEGVVDYAELVHRCRILLADAEIVATLRREIGAVFVDEYHDTDPAQVGVLQAIAGDGRDVIVVGDPDQSIYGFRGAAARGILDFPDQFPTATGEPAPVLALGITRRSGKALLTATRNLAGRLSLPRSLPGPVFQAFRHPTPAPGTPRGRVEVFTCATAGAEAEHIADLLRGAHLRDGVPWEQMAVLVRAGRAMIPALTRALVSAGVPVEVAGDEIPLAADPATRPLLLGLQVAGRGTPPDAEETHLLLGSPLGGLDSMAIRRLGRELRDLERQELAGAAMPRPSSELIAAAVAHPELLDECVPSPAVDAARRLAGLLRRCARDIRAGASAEEVLWTLWSGTDWPQRLQTEAARSGEPGRRANRDLDAICALFDVAGRSEEVAGLRGVTGFLAEVDGQQIPADPLREGDLRGGAVRLLTAHRAKGREWEVVVVAGVQEGRWPDVRRRGSLLEPERLGRDGVSDPAPTAVRIAEERRLFYVACTRARSRLIVTAVAGTEGEGDQPSRFVSELGVPVHELPGRPRRPLTMSALVGELRAVSVDPEVAPALREQAAVRLARLAAARSADGRSLVAAAQPDNWWGMRPLTRSDVAVTDPSALVQLSGSQLGSVLSCPRQWFLARKAQAESARSSAATFGSVIHVLAQFGAEGMDEAELSDRLETVWHQLDFDANWLSAVERVEAESALERFATWRDARTNIELLGTEVPFNCEVDLGDDRIRITGTADRVERDPDGRIRIVDFKTGRSAPTGAEVAQHDQLGLYQLAVQQGGFAEVTGPGAQPGGAELVYLRLSDGPGSYPKVFQQASLDDLPHHEPPDPDQPDRPDTWVHGRLTEAARIIRTEQHDARLGPGCRYCPFKSSCPAQSSGQQVVG